MLSPRACANGSRTCQRQHLLLCLPLEALRVALADAATADPATAAIRVTLRARVLPHAHDLRLDGAGPGLSAARGRSPSHALARRRAAQEIGVTAARLRSPDLPRLDAREPEATQYRALLHLAALDPEATVARRAPYAVVAEVEATLTRRRRLAEVDADHPRLHENVAFLAPLLRPVAVRGPHHTIHALPHDLHLAAAIVDRLPLAAKESSLRVAGTQARWKGRRRLRLERRPRRNRMMTRLKTFTHRVAA